jgi:antitoxin component YwqK of YwqJK toxin-antitoxin module
MKKQLLLVIMLAFGPFFTMNGQNKVIRKTNVHINYFPNGKIQSIIKTKTAQSAGFNFDSNFKRNRYREVVFDESGNRIRTIFQKTKISQAGRDCYLVKRISTDFFSSGKKQKKIKERCDRKKTVERHFNPDGKLILKRIIIDKTQ